MSFVHLSYSFLGIDSNSIYDLYISVCTEMKKLRK